jgi:hypothetical protein
MFFIKKQELNDPVETDFYHFLFSTTIKKSPNNMINSRLQIYLDFIQTSV